MFLRLIIPLLSPIITCVVYSLTRRVSLSAAPSRRGSLVSSQERERERDVGTQKPKEEEEEDKEEDEEDEEDFATFFFCISLYRFFFSNTKSAFYNI